MANEKTPVVWDDTTKKHRPLGTGEKMGGLDASSIISSDSGNLIQTGSDGLAYVSGSSIADPRADNLLETSQNGRLQVTPERIAEWLDGHPQDAALIADAINVVSGDAGNVIVQGTDKGAYLSKGAISAAVAGMTDAQKAQLADAIAARIAADIADGQTIVASGGKLTSNPTNATAAQKKAINQALADADSGLVVDPSTGRLQVDFSNMPTDKFEELLKGLKMLVPLGANKHLYVNKGSSAASDALDDGRGAQAKPFKTIQACVNYLTANYALGNYTAFIHVVANTYSENLTLPPYSRGTGMVRIVADSGSRDVTVKAVQNAAGFVYSPCRVTGGEWLLEHLTLERVEAVYNGADVYMGSCLEVNGDDAVCYLRGCRIAQSFPSDANLPGTQYEIRLMFADNGGVIDIAPYDVAMSISVSNTATHDRNVSVFNIARGGSLRWQRPVVTDAISDYSWDITCSGSCTKFISVWQGSSVNTIGGGPVQTFSGTVTGKHYEVFYGSFITGTGGSETFYPGDSDPEGTVDATTYCWYR